MTHIYQVCPFLMIPILFPHHGTNIIQIDLFCIPPSEFKPGLWDPALILSMDDLKILSLKRLKILHWKHSQERIWDNYLDGDLTTAQRQAELLVGILETPTRRISNCKHILYTAKQPISSLWSKEWLHQTPTIVVYCLYFDICLCPSRTQDNVYDMPQQSRNDDYQ